MPERNDGEEVFTLRNATIGFDYSLRDLDRHLTEAVLPRSVYDQMVMRPIYDRVDPRMYRQRDFTIDVDGEVALTIRRDPGARSGWRVDAPGLEEASEAGRVFVESIRNSLERLR